MAQNEISEFGCKNRKKCHFLPKNGNFAVLGAFFRKMETWSENRFFLVIFHQNRPNGALKPPKTAILP